VNEKCEPPFFHSVSWGAPAGKKWRLVFVLEFLFLFVQAKRKRKGNAVGKNKLAFVLDFLFLFHQGKRKMK
jgi:hypothetical protein